MPTFIEHDDIFEKPVAYKWIATRHDKLQNQKNEAMRKINATVTC